MPFFFTVTVMATLENTLKGGNNHPKFVEDSFPHFHITLLLYQHNRYPLSRVFVAVCDLPIIYSTIILTSTVCLKQCSSFDGYYYGRTRAPYQQCLFLHQPEILASIPTQFSDRSGAGFLFHELSNGFFNI